MRKGRKKKHGRVLDWIEHGDDRVTGSDGTTTLKEGTEVLRHRDKRGIDTYLPTPVLGQKGRHRMIEDECGFQSSDWTSKREGGTLTPSSTLTFH